MSQISSIQPSLCLCTQAFSAAGIVPLALKAFAHSSPNKVRKGPREGSLSPSWKQSPSLVHPCSPQSGVLLQSPTPLLLWPLAEPWKPCLGHRSRFWPQVSWNSGGGQSSGQLSLIPPSLGDSGVDSLFLSPSSQNRLRFYSFVSSLRIVVSVFISTGPTIPGLGLCA